MQPSAIAFGVSRASRNFAAIGNTIDVSTLPRIDASAQFGLPAGPLRLPFNPSTGQFVTGGTTTTFNNVLDGKTAIQAAGRLFGVDIAAERAHYVFAGDSPIATC